MGWTVVPPNSEPQQVHADIVSELGDPPFPRQSGLGRFHHVAWKPDHVSSCTTQIIPRAFTGGYAADDQYKSIKSVVSWTMQIWC